MLFNRVQSVFHPEQYHGWGRSHRFFEGWYFKVVNASEDSAYAFIPGIAMDEQGEKHAFVQVLDGKKRMAEYLRFPWEQFRPEPGKLDLIFGNCRVTEDFIILDLPEIQGELRFTGRVKWPDRWYAPGIMGPYTFVPFMECYHGIVSMDHLIEGSLHVRGDEISFSGGRGYTEKDWGHSFPSAYFWMQSNHFTQPGISFKASVARIPWLGSSFTGFICGLWIDGKWFTFTTYNGSVLKRAKAGLEKVELVLENKNHRMEILVSRDHATSLASPLSGLMDGRISETMTSLISLTLTDKKQQKILFQDTGRNGALEVAGRIEEIEC